MSEIVMIDGNNLLHALRQLGPGRALGREKMMKLIERWAVDNRREVTLYFDGPVPRGPFAGQFRSSRIEVIFSAPRTADDLIVERLLLLRPPGIAVVVSDDSAIQYEARRYRCRTLGTAAFIAVLLPPGASAGTPPPASPPFGDKPAAISPEEKQQWLDLFDDGGDDEPFDGFDAMKH